MFQEKSLFRTTSKEVLTGNQTPDLKSVKIIQDELCVTTNSLSSSSVNSIKNDDEENKHQTKNTHNEEKKNQTENTDKVIGEYESKMNKIIEKVDAELDKKIDKILERDPKEIVEESDKSSEEEKGLNK